MYVNLNKTINFWVEKQSYVEQVIGIPTYEYVEALKPIR